MGASKSDSGEAGQRILDDLISILYLVSNFTDDRGMRRSFNIAVKKKCGKCGMFTAT